MTPPTDTIPEAREVAELGKDIDDMSVLYTMVEKACLSYHSRKLAECGDATKGLYHDIGTLKHELERNETIVENLQKQCEELRTRAEKAEAEVAALNALLTLPHEYCLACGGRGGHEEGCHGTTPLIALKAQLSTLQQDVGPLVECIKGCEGDGGCRATKALTTFLAKHPELVGKS